MKMKIGYSIIRSVFREKVQGDNGLIVPKETVTDEIALHVDEYENDNVIRTGYLDHVDGSWVCADDPEGTELLNARPNDELWVPRSYLVRVNEDGKPHAVQGPVSLSLLDVYMDREIPFELAVGEMPHDALDSIWFDGEAVVERPENPTTLRGEGMKIIIENAPAGSVFYAIVGGEEIEFSDSEIEVDEPGQLGVRIVSGWPMKEARFDIQVE